MGEYPDIIGARELDYVPADVRTDILARVDAVLSTVRKEWLTPDEIEDEAKGLILDLKTIAESVSIRALFCVDSTRTVPHKFIVLSSERSVQNERGGYAF